MIIYISNEQKDLKIDEDDVEKLVREVVSFEGLRYDEVSIHFVDTESICSLHNEYFNDPSPTDCISFPMDQDIQEEDPHKVLGDVVVCPETAIKYAKANACDTYEELTLYTVHGLLHLMGYDDIEEQDIQKMREAEDRHMKNLKKLDLCLSLWYS